MSSIASNSGFERRLKYRAHTGKTNCLKSEDDLKGLKFKQYTDFQQIWTINSQWNTHLFCHLSTFCLNSIVAFLILRAQVNLSYFSEIKLLKISIQALFRPVIWFKTVTFPVQISVFKKSALKMEMYAYFYHAVKDFLYMACLDWKHVSQSQSELSRLDRMTIKVMGARKYL